jgi:hypothetical protein
MPTSGNYLVSYRWKGNVAEPRQSSRRDFGRRPPMTTWLDHGMVVRRKHPTHRADTPLVIPRARSERRPT